MHDGGLVHPFMQRWFPLERRIDIAQRIGRGEDFEVSELHDKLANLALRDAFELLSAGTWIQGASARTKSGKVVRANSDDARTFDAVGALYQVTGLAHVRGLDHVRHMDRDGGVDVYATFVIAYAALQIAADEINEWSDDVKHIENKITRINDGNGYVAVERMYARAMGLTDGSV